MKIEITVDRAEIKTISTLWIMDNTRHNNRCNGYILKKKNAKIGTIKTLEKIIIPVSI